MVMYFELFPPTQQQEEEQLLRYAAGKPTRRAIFGRKCALDGWMNVFIIDLLTTWMAIIVFEFMSLLAFCLFFPGTNPATAAP